MVLPLTPFEALVGFVSPAELAASLAAVPELAGVVGAEACGAAAAAAAQPGGSPAATAALRASFAQLMRSALDAHGPAVAALAARLGAEQAAGRALAAREALVLRLSQQYPGDVGVLSSYFLNYLQLQPGQGCALAANEPHAYLSGECVECMATSDNVVRAGLTPKLRDLDTLTSMLTYSQAPVAVLAGEPAGEGLRTYAPPFDEFALDSIALAAGAELALPPLPGPAVILVTEGNAGAAGGGREAELKRGGAVFVLPGTQLTLRAAAGGAFTAFRARVADVVFAAAA